MARAINTAGGSGMDVMQLLLMLNQLEESKGEREQARLDAQADRNFERQKMDREDLRTRRAEMFQMYTSLKGEMNGEKPKYSDKQLDEIMGRQYPEMWKSFSVTGEDTPAAPVVPEDSFFPETPPIKEKFNEGGIVGAAKNIGIKGIAGVSALLGGKKAGQRTANQLQSEGFGGTAGMLVDAGRAAIGPGAEDVPIQDVGPSLGQVENMVRLGVDIVDILDNLESSGLSRGVATEMLRSTFMKLDSEQGQQGQQAPLDPNALNLPAIQ